MSTSLSRRQFAGLATASATTVALAPSAVAAEGFVGHTKIATGPNAAALKATLKGVIGKPTVGAVCSAAGIYGRLDIAAGQFSLARNEAARANARARVSSITKPMVAVAVFQLIEKGTWSLKTTIDEVLPGLWAGRGKVTVAQLMNHTSGMPDHINDVLPYLPGFNIDVIEDFTNDQWSHAKIIREAKKLSWKFTPGTGWSYSNTGYVVLSMMLEKVYGRNIGTILRTRVFDHMGMNQTRLSNSAWVSAAHLELEDVAIEGRRKERLQNVNMSVFSGSGGAMATSADITDFWALLLRHQMLSKSSVEKMITPVGAAVDWNYGYGVQIMDDVFTGKGLLYGHSGGGFGSTAMALSNRNGWRRMAYMMTGRPWDMDNAMQLEEEQYKLMDACFALTTNRSGRSAGYDRATARRVTMPVLAEQRFRLG